MTDLENNIDAQAEIFAFLNDPKTHGGAEVRRIDTHAASVFLAGDRVLKIKRNVKFPFLDFSTLEKRRQACTQEIEINRRFAPQIYRGVIAVTRAPDGSLRLGGDGVPVEWAVDMTRFDENQTIDHLAAAGRIDGPLAESIADAIAVTHEKATSFTHTNWGDAIPSLIAANTAALTGHCDHEAIHSLHRHSLEIFERSRDLLRQRQNDGFVRRCHGDLHLANIALIDAKPVLFDAIEFDPKIATIDILYDLAFVLMDLLHFGQDAAANTAFNRYLQKTSSKNLAGLSILPLFMSLRAAIRAHVIFARQSSDRDKRKADDRTALEYFKLAQRLVEPATAKLVAIGGLSGTGKSTVARGLASSLGTPPGAVVLRSDILRKLHFGVSELDRLPPDAYSPSVTRQIYQDMMALARKVLAQGYSVILDAVFARPDERTQVTMTAEDQRVTWFGFFLYADTATRLTRVAGRTLDASDANEAVAQQQEHYDLGSIDWHRIDANGSSTEATAQIKQIIARH